MPDLHKELQPAQQEISKKILDAISKGSTKEKKIENPEDEKIQKIHLFVEKLNRVLEKDDASQETASPPLSRWKRVVDSLIINRQRMEKLASYEVQSQLYEINQSQIMQSQNGKRVRFDLSLNKEKKIGGEESEKEEITYSEPIESSS